MEFREEAFQESEADKRRCSSEDQFRGGIGHGGSGTAISCLRCFVERRETVLFVCSGGEREAEDEGGVRGRI